MNIGLSLVIGASVTCSLVALTKNELLAIQVIKTLVTIAGLYCQLILFKSEDGVRISNGFVARVDFHDSADHVFGEIDIECSRLLLIAERLHHSKNGQD